MGSFGFPRPSGAAHLGLAPANPPARPAAQGATAERTDGHCTRQKQPLNEPPSDMPAIKGNDEFISIKCTQTNSNC